VINFHKSCELVVIDAESGEPVANVQLYGVDCRDMTKVPPAVSPVEVFRRAGIDPDRFITSIFHIVEARRFRP